MCVWQYWVINFNNILLYRYNYYYVVSLITVYTLILLLDYNVRNGRTTFRNICRGTYYYYYYYYYYYCFLLLLLLLRMTTATEHSKLSGTLPSCLTMYAEDVQLEHWV